MQIVNYLDNLQDFEQVLKSYHPSQASMRILQSTPLVLLIGPTAAGRNTCINLLVETGDFHSIVSDTTRHKRQNKGVWEQDGAEYWFKSETEILEGLKKGDYLEAAIIHEQQVSGISIKEMERARSARKIAINEIEIDGAEHVHSMHPDALFIFLLPPSFGVWMERLRGRGDMDDIELNRRLKSAINEISTALEADYFQFVVNNEIHEAAYAVNKLAHGRPPNPNKQASGRMHSKLLILEIQSHLARVA